MKILVLFILSATLLMCKSKPTYLNLDNDSAANVEQMQSNVNAGLDSFKKYSSLILVKEDNKVIGHATGYFVEYKGDLYLISSYHVFYSTDMINKRFYQPRANKLLYRVLLQDNIYTFDSIDLKPLIEKNVIPVGEFEIADIYAYKIKNKGNEKIYTINSFAGNLLQVKERTSVFSFGFPNTTFGQDAKNTLEPTLLTTQTVFGVDKNLIENKDTISKYYFVTMPAPSDAEGHGRSGSPLFFLGEDGKYHFYGTFSSSSQLTNTMIITKPTKLFP